MPATADLHALGQSLWIDNITRGFLDDGTIAGYINDMSVTGRPATSIFQKAIAGGHEYDDAIRAHMQAGLKGEELFFELAIEDLRRACDLFAPIHEATNGLDGWCSLEVSPLLANDTHSTIEQAKKLRQADRKNLYIKVPGTPEETPAIEELTFAGIPVNVTLIFSVEHYMRAAEAYPRAGASGRRRPGRLGLLGRLALHLPLGREDLPHAPRRAEGHQRARDRRRLLQGLRRMARDRPLGARAEGGPSPEAALRLDRHQDPALSDSLYVSGLAAPDTVNTMPDKTLKAFHDHGTLDGPLRPTGPRAWRPSPRSRPPASTTRSGRTSRWRGRRSSTGRRCWPTSRARPRP